MPLLHVPGLHVHFPYVPAGDLKMVISDPLVELLPAKFLSSSSSNFAYPRNNDSKNRYFSYPTHQLRDGNAPSITMQ